MTDQLVESLRTAKPLRLLLLLALILPLIASAPVAKAAARVQPILLQMASQHPDSRVSVIVQKQVTDNGPEDLVTKLGGSVTKDLTIINAFAAQMPARVVPELGKATGVRWVSLDALVTQSTNTQIFTTWATDQGITALSSISSGFNSTTIRSGNYIWFNSYVKVQGLASGAPTTLYFDNSVVQYAGSGFNYSVNVPAATLTFSPSATTATTTYDAVNGIWNSIYPTSLSNQPVFLAGVMYRAPYDLPGNISPLAWTGRFTTDTSGVSVNTWKWAAAVYTRFNSDYSALGVKPCDSSSASQYHNSDTSGTPENYKSYVTGGATGSGGSNYTGSYSSNLSVTPTRVFSNVKAITDAAQGSNTAYAYGSNVTGSFTGFAAEKSPGNSITRVEVALKTYIPALLASGDDPRISASVNGVSGSTVTLNHSAFANYVGAANAGTIYVDITSSRSWQWADFDNGLQITLDQSRFASRHLVYYAAIGLRVTSDTGTDSSGGTSASSLPNSATDTSRLVNTYDNSIRATNIWNEGPSYMQGQSIGVAVVDSGIAKTKDLRKRVVANVNFNAGQNTSTDKYGHGTFVAGIIGGDGTQSAGAYLGVAPKTNLINVRVSDDQGMATESDVVNGLGWILQNKTRYNIRVVNMSLNSGTAQSYQTSPMDAAAEVLWFNGMVVVVSAGNNGNSTLYAPANDPFVITVGATNEQGTSSLSDDTIAPFSAYGVTETGAAKPDLVAPGTNIISLLPQNAGCTISLLHAPNSVNANYFRMSGTSMAAPMVSGAVALLLQSNPNLNPDQVKYRLMATAAKTTSWAGYDPARAGAGYLDVYAAVHGTTTATANTGTVASHLLWTGSTPPAWDSVNWSSVNWSSVNWSSVNWGSVNWSSVNWGSDYWGQ